MGLPGPQPSRKGPQPPPPRALAYSESSHPRVSRDPLLVRGSSSPPSREEHHPPHSHTREATPPSGLGPLPERPRPGLWARPRGASSPSSPRILARTMNPPPDSSTKRLLFLSPAPPRRPRLPAPFPRLQPPSPHHLQFLKGLGNHLSSLFPGLLRLRFSPATPWVPARRPSSSYSGHPFVLKAPPQASVRFLLR